MALMMMFDGSVRCRLQVAIRSFLVLMKATTSAANMALKLFLSEDCGKKNPAIF